MIIGYDPVSSTVILDFENGRPQMEFHVDRLIAKYYCDGGIVAATMVEDDLEVSFLPVEGAPIDVRLIPTAKRRWLIQFKFPE